MKDMGSLIKELRVKNNLTQDELADKLGVQKSAVSKWERGAVQNIKKDLIEEIAKIFNIRPSYLMGWDSSTIEENNIQSLIIKEYGEDSIKALSLYTQLDSNDRAEIRGEMKQMLKADKYSIKKRIKKRLNNVIYVNFKNKPHNC